MNELETHVLEIIGESVTSPDVFTDDDDGLSQIRDSLNDAIEELCMATGCYRRTYLVPLKESKTFYRIDNNSETDRFGWPVSVWLQTPQRRVIQKDLAWMIKNIPFWLKGTGTPEYYGMIALDTLWTYPTVASDSGTLEIDAVAIPRRYDSDTDRIKIMEQYKWACVRYAVSEYWASRGDAKSAQDQLGKYLEQANLMRLHPVQPERYWTYKTEKQ